MVCCLCTAVTIDGRGFSSASSTSCLFAHFRLSGNDARWSAAKMASETLFRNLRVTSRTLRPFLLQSMYWTHAWPTLPPPAINIPCLARSSLGFLCPTLVTPMTPMPFWPTVPFFFPFEKEIHKCSFALVVCQRLSCSLWRKHIPHVLQFPRIAHLPRLPSARKSGLFERVWGCLLVSICRDQKQSWIVSPALLCEGHRGQTDTPRMKSLHLYNPWSELSSCSPVASPSFLSWAERLC